VKVTFAPIAWEHYLWWQTNDRRVLKRINLLIRDITRDDTDDDGIGKPERLRNELASWSSRRITDEHRLVYRVDAEGDDLLIARCRHHYGDR
jgi:toxin YoeB